MPELEPTGLRYDVPQSAREDLAAIHERDTWVNSLTEAEYEFAKACVHQHRVAEHVDRVRRQEGRPR